MILGPFESFWIFVILFFITSVGMIVMAWMLASRRKERHKYDVFEAGQSMDIIPNYVGLFGSIRYFAYAMAFFVLDSFVWILVAYTGIIGLNGGAAVIYLLIYILTLLLGLWYYVSRVLEVYKK